jgi:hypothetical protein
MLTFIFALTLLLGSSPSPKHIEPIRYPEVARLARRQGIVTAHVETDGEGKVVRVNADGSPTLADTVMAALKQWRFSVEDGNKTDIVFEFKLVGKPRGGNNAETFVTFDLPAKVTVVSQPPLCDHCVPQNTE